MFSHRGRAYQRRVLMCLSLLGVDCHSILILIVTLPHSIQQSSIMLHPSTTPEARLPSREHSKWSAHSVSVIPYWLYLQHGFPSVTVECQVCLCAHVWVEVNWHNLSIQRSKHCEDTVPFYLLSLFQSMKRVWMRLRHDPRMIYIIYPDSDVDSGP